MRHFGDFIVYWIKDFLLLFIQQKISKGATWKLSFLHVLFLENKSTNQQKQWWNDVFHVTCKTSQSAKNNISSILQKSAQKGIYALFAQNPSIL